MKQLDFEPQEFADRLRRTRAALAEHGVDAMLVHDPASIFWLTGWRGKGYQIYQALVVTVEDDPLVRRHAAPRTGPARGRGRG